MKKAFVGAWLCRRLDDGMVIRRRITETEAYCGEEDKACHLVREASRNDRQLAVFWRRWCWKGAFLTSFED